jgi:flagellum-specific peptidoglycan hydrolase FlgJ
LVALFFFSGAGKDGGYATSLTYVEKLISIIERWNLTQYDVKDSGSSVLPAFIR